MTSIEVHVDLGGREALAGALYSHRRRGTESATFAYATEYLSAYLSAAGAYAVDPELPLSSGARQTRAGRALFGALTDCAPDRWGRTLIARREAALARSEGRTARALGEIDYLLGVRDDLRQGALRFRFGQGPFLADEDTGVPALTDLPALLDLAARVEQGTADLPDLQRLSRVGSSLGGARPKAHVRDHDGRIAIAKFPSADQDTWNVMAWEKVALDLAERLWRRFVFSVLISNTDDHLRNHGFLHERGDVWRLAPAFDLNPSPAPGPKFHATMIDETDDPASLSGALAVADYFRLPDLKARAILRDVLDAVSRWRDLAALHGLSPSEIAEMEPAFAAVTEADHA